MDGNELEKWVQILVAAVWMRAITDLLRIISMNVLKVVIRERDVSPLIGPLMVVINIGLIIKFAHYT